jgi:hypothetical protein
VRWLTILIAVSTAVLSLPAASTAEDPPAVPQVVYIDRTFQGKDVDWWARRAVQARKDANKRADTIVRLKRTLAHSPTLTEAIALATTVYRASAADLWRRGRCESHFRRYARNASGASGYWQFLPSTWASTPFARFSIWSVYAQAFAAAWMMGPAHRSGEWSCR